VISEDLVFERITEAQTSVDPVKLSRAVENSPRKLSAKLRSASDVGATSARCVPHITRMLAYVCLRTDRIPFDSCTVHLSPSQLADVRGLVDVSR
jgi:hypothetical protein